MRRATPALRSIMWAAYALTLIRLPLGVAFWVTYGDRAWSVALVAAAAISDALDGRVARWARRRRAGAGASDAEALSALSALSASAQSSSAENVPHVGDWLDPLADKAFVVLALAAIVVHVPSARWPVVLIAARELALAPAMLVYAIRRARGASTPALRARLVGKAATVAQFIAAGFVVADSPAAWPLAIVTAALGVVAVVDQLVAARGR